MAVALVDETGDPGTGGRGTPWFSWVAVIIPDSALHAMTEARDQLSVVSARNWSGARLGGDDLLGALTFMNTLEGWQWVAVVSDTTRTSTSTASLIHDATQYRFYTMLVMLERLSWVGEGWREQVHVFLERPNDTGFTEHRLRQRHQDGLPNKWANYETLPSENIHFASPVEQPSLTYAHMVACAVGKAVNPHPIWTRILPGAVFPHYLELIGERVWRGPWRGEDNLTDRGFTLLPAPHRRQIRAQLGFIGDWLMRLGLAA